jgi:hypothetical protein
MFACNDFYFRLQLPLIIIHITCISLSLHRTSAPIHLTSVLGVLGTQETSCILIAELLERDTFDLFLPEFNKPWVIHLRETWCYSTNLCTWRPNNVYKNRSVRRHQRQKCLSLKTSSFLRRNFLQKVKWEDNRTLIRLLNLSYMCWVAQRREVSWRRPQCAWLPCLKGCGHRDLSSYWTAWVR